ncbi:MAG: integrase [Sphaerisporangium sp.]|nr:integrase [Sphaerisporangium sp.]
MRRRPGVLLAAGTGPQAACPACAAGAGPADGAQRRRPLNTAAEDELIKKNLCRIRNAGVERPEERPVLTVPEVFALAGAVPPRFRALVLLATFGSLRWGELAALRRFNPDLDARTVKIEASVSEMKTGELVTGQPKSDAGARVVALPEIIIGDLT